MIRSQTGIAETPTHLTAAALQTALRNVDPAALLVAPRILRRVIKEDRQLTGLGIKVPHRKTYTIGRQRLLEFVDVSELGLAANHELPETVLLIARPDAERLAAMSAQAALVKYWRLLFHARVHVAMDQHIAEGGLTLPELRDRIHRLGEAEFEEVRTVLRQEAFLFPPRNDRPGHADRSVYVEFAAVYLELRFFTPSLMPRYFPALADLRRVDELLAEDVDGRRLWEETRLAGASDPIDPHAVVEGEEPSDQPSPRAELLLTPLRPISEDRCRKLLRRADKVAAVGNVVRAALFRARAAAVESPELRAHARQGAQDDLDRLVQRLQAALEMRDRDLERWRDVLMDLVDRALRGIWTSELRLLFDLQKVCVDHEREIYTVDLVEWMLSMGERPIKRPLPSQRDVLMTKHLRSAAGRLAAVRISEAHRQRLTALLQSAAARAEEQLRNRYRPQMSAALDEVGLRPQNVPERVASKKLIEELLDRVVDRGFFSMGDLRDALSRNNLKLPDFGGRGEFLHGDPLLRADRRLATVLDGVYGGGEIYLRWMQQLSSLAFGTPLGRFLTRYVALPFGGAYLILEGLQHSLMVFVRWLLGTYVPIVGARLNVDGGYLLVERSAEVTLRTPLGWFVVGWFLFAVMHIPAFRAGVNRVLRETYRLVRTACYDWPLWFARLPWVRRLFQSWPFEFAFRFILKPLVFTAVVGLAFPLRQISATTLSGSAVAMFLGMNLMLNSPLGRQVQEVAADWIVQGWHKFGIRILTGLFHLVMDVFRSFLETIERLLYSVDEWLRFKSGETNLSLAVKGVLSVVWFFATYVIRFCVNLLIEPQINPIKHFPVVTVSHKLLFPFIPVLAHVFSITMDEGQALAVAGAIIWCIPGVFGFLAWELKENWRLYAANRPRNLQPVPVGLHGETLIRLLRPGFHSGTLPKVYARLRRAERKARERGSWRGVRKYLRSLHHVEIAIRRYIEREFIALIAESQAWRDAPLLCREIQVSSNRALAEICRPLDAQAGLWLAFEADGGWIVAGIARTNWLAELSSAQCQVLNSSLL